jgi:hypothetical protein
MNSSTPYLNELTQRVIAGAATDRERAVKIHDYVRDTVRYGFTSRFDEASPQETLEAGAGHCNPQTNLFVSMLRAAGIEARFHFVTLSGEILRGVLPNVPAEISHSFAEVRLDGRWIKVDSYIVDPAHARGAAKKLASEGREVGYGFHRRGTTSWNGREDAFAQLADPSMVIEDHGTWQSAEDFYASDAFRHRLGPLTYTAMFSLMPSIFFRAFSTFIDGRIDRMRALTDGAPSPFEQPLAAAA